MTLFTDFSSKSVHIQCPVLMSTAPNVVPTFSSLKMSGPQVQERWVMSCDETALNQDHNHTDRNLPTWPRGHMGGQPAVTPGITVGLPVMDQ